jgi:hypothetical protein
MNNFIYGYDSWVKTYRSSPSLKRSIWIYVQLDNEQEIYLRDYEDWYELKKFISDTNHTLKKIGLRYRSNFISVDTNNADGVYLVRSAKGEFGGKTKQCYTMGLLENNKVKKTMWLVPELVEESSYIDDIDSCFEEGIIRYGTEAKTI